MVSENTAKEDKGTTANNLGWSRWKNIREEEQDMAKESQYSEEQKL